MTGNNIRGFEHPDRYHGRDKIKKMEGESGANGRYVKNKQGLGRALNMSVTVKIQE